jgi:hypothetical protein
METEEEIVVGREFCRVWKRVLEELDGLFWMD